MDSIIYIGNIENAFVSEHRDLEYLICMFWLVRIREIAVVSSGGRMCGDDPFLKEYQKKGFLKKIWYTSLLEKLAANIEVKNKHICFLYQPAFLYGMHLTKYMRRAMLREK